MTFPGFYVCPECKPVAVEKVKRGERIGSVWRDGSRLVMRRNATLPDRCAKCNAPTEGYRVWRTAYWHHPAIFLLLVIPPLYLMAAWVAWIAQRQCRVPIGLCRVHRRRWTRAFLTGWGAILGGITGIAGSAAALKPNIEVFVTISVVAIVAGIITLFIESAAGRARRATRHYVFLNGFHPDFLNELPEWPGQ